MHVAKYVHATAWIDSHACCKMGFHLQNLSPVVLLWCIAFTAVSACSRTKRSKLMSSGGRNPRWSLPTCRHSKNTGAYSCSASRDVCLVLNNHSSLEGFAFLHVKAQEVYDRSLNTLPKGQQSSTWDAEQVREPKNSKHIGLSKTTYYGKTKTRAQCLWCCAKGIR